MPTPDSSSDRLSRLARVWADALTYALAVTALVAVGAVVLGVATGGGIVRAKVVLFGVGWLLLAYATVRLWPTSPEDAQSARRTGVGDSVPGEAASKRFQTAVRALPPVRWTGLPAPHHRMTMPGKLLLTSLLVLLLSFLMETVFGVA